MARKICTKNERLRKVLGRFANEVYDMAEEYSKPENEEIFAKVILGINRLFKSGEVSAGKTREGR